jgi:hypothetical protein
MPSGETVMSSFASELAPPVAEEAVKSLQDHHILWRRAFAKLAPPIEYIDSKEPSIDAMITSLKAAATAKANFLENGSRLYDIFGKIVKGITGLEGIIDKGLAFDVSGKAALPWAAIKAALHVKSAPSGSYFQYTCRLTRY